MWTVVGQDRAVSMLSRALKEDRLSHAYLFVGPPQVGKATAAREFAQALNCQGEDPPCHECRECHMIGERKHPDVEVVSPGGVCDEPDHRDHAAEGSKDIRICQVRRLERLLSRAPFEGRFRVVIVDPADALNEEAANAFLKTLEEPPASAVIILVTTREEALPSTVRSRCRRVPFAPMPVASLAEALESGWSVPADEARPLACLSGGRLGWALAALEDESVLEARKEALNEIWRLAAAGRDERFAYAGRLAGQFPRDRQGVLAALDLWRDWWRDVLLVRAGLLEGREDALPPLTNVDALDKLRLEGTKYNMADLIRFLVAIGETRRYLQENVNPYLALEVLMLELPAPVSGKEAEPSRR
jgi:DNA polymerase-3 subunit delta'